MKNKNIIFLLSIFAIFLMVMLFGDHKLLPFLGVPFVFSHCDTMNGPVITIAKKALETGNVNLVLIWVQKKDEVQIKKAFKKTLAVRKLNTEAKELADMYFFETLVRIHRAGEGASYTGIKPAGTKMDPGIEAADKALETGSVDDLVKKMSHHLSSGILKHFKQAMKKKKHANESVKAGREYVKAYVEFIHYVEKLHLDISSKSAHHEQESGTVEEHHSH